MSTNPLVKVIPNEDDYSYLVVNADASIIGERVDPDDWKDIVKTGRDAVAHMDIGRWVIGDLGTMVKAKYGEDEFGAFADEINIHRRSAEDYRAVARYYPKETRDSRHNYSMHREAMRLNDLDASIALLNDAAVKLWSVRDLIEQIRGMKGKNITPEILPRLTPEIITAARAYRAGDVPAADVAQMVVALIGENRE